MPRSGERLPVRFELGVPPTPRWPRLAVAASVLIHLVLLRVVVFSGWIPQNIAPPAAPVILVSLPSGGDIPQGTTQLRSAAPGGRMSAPSRATASNAPVAVAHAVPPAPPPPALPSPIVTAAPAPAARGDTASPDAGPRRIGPGLARGKLWVAPLPLPPRELAERLQRTHAQLADSAVTSIIQAFLDSIAADPASRAVVMPSWTTTIAGKKFGLDSRNIYIAGLKIPAAVLGLLHLPTGGNESKAFDRSGWLYEDLRFAAQRSANVEDFKREIREIRVRKEQEREFERNQRTPPKEEQ